MTYLKLILSFIAIIAIVGVGALIFRDSPEEVIEKVPVENKEEPPPEKEFYTVIGVGDIMMGTNYPDRSSLPPNDGKDMLDDVKDELTDADVTFGNLEGTLLNSGGTPKDCGGGENCHSFRMPEHYAGYLKDAGFDIMSIANNHSGDMGEKGRTSTMKTLDKYGIKYSGLISVPYTVFEKDGVKYGMAAFAPNNGTQSLNDHDNAVKVVKKLKQMCDIVIVSFHGGAEGTGATHVPKRREFYLGEDRGDIYAFAHQVIDAGADMVFGHGPHVPRGMELYKGRLIAYSLGNFCTYKKFGLSGALGIAPMLKVTVEKDGSYKSHEVISIKQVRGGVPVIDSTGAAKKLVDKLSNEDFGSIVTGRM